jgi:hypothetical protein
MPDVPFFRGKDATFRLFQDGKEVLVNAKTWSVKRNTTDGSDGVNGEDRDRPYSVTNFYDLSATCYQRDAKILVALLDDQDNDDAQVAPLDKAVGINIKIIDGSRAAFVAKEVTLGAWELNQGGRTEAVMLTIPLRARYFSKIKSIG